MQGHKFDRQRKNITCTGHTNSIDKGRSNLSKALFGCNLEGSGREAFGGLEI